MIDPEALRVLAYGVQQVLRSWEIKLPRKENKCGVHPGLQLLAW